MHQDSALRGNKDEATIAKPTLKHLNKEIHYLNPETAHLAPTIFIKKFQVGVFSKSESRPTGVQLKKKKAQFQPWLD